MVARIALWTLALGAGRSLAQQFEDFDFCKDEFCPEESCPFYGNFNMEFPECNIYSTAGLDDLGYEGTGSGMYDIWLNVPALDPGCHWILRSPASTDMVGCGYVAGTWANGGCDNVQLDDTFMVQFCCGAEDCAKAGVSVPTVKRTPGAKTSPAHRRTLLAGGGGAGLELFYKNGTKMEPVETGMPPEKRGLQTTPAKKAKKAFTLKRQDDEEDPLCSGWNPEGNGYTKPSPETQLVATGGSAGQEITISVSRTASWSTTIEVGASFGIEDIFGLSMSMSHTFEESIEETVQRTFQVPEGQQGDIGFTPYLYCEEGTGMCDGEDVSGEMCTPYKDGSGELAGLYHVIQRGTGGS